jgi:hypothetical protein
MRSSAASFLLSLMLVAAPAAAGAIQTPQPFPKPGSTGTTTGTPNDTAQPPRSNPPATPAGSPSAAAPSATAAASPEAPPTEATLGLPLPPGAQFLASYDAGQGQRYYLFGAAGNFAEVLAFYRNALKQRGDVVFEEPATQIFEVGRFREENMAFPPSVTVKDYMWGNIGGYLNPKPGGQPARFATVIQIVPIPASDRGR